jgi:hypothetical protein
LLTRPALLSAIALVLAVCAFQLWIAPDNPPGFFRDEAALAYNAYTIEHDGRDEYGARFPLYFSSFLDYKSPIFVYALAPVFLVTGPHREVARALGAASVLSALLLLGWLGYRRSGRPLVGVATFVVGGTTPWLFELGRMALEVTMLPLFLCLVLLAVERAARLDRWHVWTALPVALALGGLTYVYAGGRLLAPLLAAGLLVLVNRARWRWVATAAVGFVLTQIPLLVYRELHPGALSRRWDATTFITPDMSPFEVAWRTVVNYLQDLELWHYVGSGDVKPYAHTPGTSALLAASVALAVAGVVIAVRRLRGDPFWRFALVALVVSPLPAALTADRYHAIRLTPFAVMLVVFAIPAIDSIGRNAVIAVAVAAAGLVQFGLFVHDWHVNGPSRTTRFEADIPPLLGRGWANGGTVYVDFDDHEPLTLARWYALVQGPQTHVVRLPDGGIPPTGATAFGRTQECDYRCTRLAQSQSGDYWIARAEGPKAP